MRLAPGDDGQEPRREPGSQALRHRARRIALRRRQRRAQLAREMLRGMSRVSGGDVLRKIEKLILLVSRHVLASRGSVRAVAGGTHIARRKEEGSAGAEALPRTGRRGLSLYPADDRG